MRVVLTAGQHGDAPQAATLLDKGQPGFVLADTAYDADHFRAAVAKAGAIAVIPSNPSRATKLDLDEVVYEERHLVECCFGKLKHFRRVATRYEKTAQNFLAMVLIASTILWLR